MYNVRLSHVIIIMAGVSYACSAHSMVQLYPEMRGVTP